MSEHFAEPSRPSEPDESERRLEEAIAEYLRAVETEESLDRAAFLARYADIQAELALFIENRERVERIAGPLRELGVECASLPLEGQRLGDYRIVREIGRGGMGAVFEAVQESLGRRVALKALPGSFALQPNRVERFRREARATARLKHPNVVPVHEVGEAQGLHFYTMEYIDGPSLRDEISNRVERNGRARGRRTSSAFDPEYIANSVLRMAELAEGLEEAHERGLVHRDIKPSNILIDKWGRYVLVDFGLVHEEEAQTLTRSGEMLGTLAYMSPEQVARKRVDARSDVYSLGVTLYEVLTLSPPFDGESDHELQNAILLRDPIRPRRRNPRLHRDLETIICHSLEKRPEARYRTAGDFAADLRRLLHLEPIQAKRRSAASLLLRRAWRNKERVALAVVLLAVTASLIWWSASRAPRFSMTAPLPLTTYSGLTRDPALSPDEEWIVYASDRGGEENLDLWLQRMDGQELTRLTSHVADDSQPAFSPSGRRIVFHSTREPAGVYELSLDGGPPRSLVPGGRNPKFAADADTVVCWADSRVMVVSGDEPPRSIVTPGVAFGPRYPVWSPDGNRVLFAGRDPEEERSGRVWAEWFVLSLDDPRPVRTGVSSYFEQYFTPRLDVHPVLWVDGQVFFVGWEDDRQSVNLWVIPFGTGSGKPEGPPQKLTRETGRVVSPAIGKVQADGSRTVVYATLERQHDIYSLRLDTNEGRLAGTVEENLERLVANTAFDITPWVTRDGSTLFWSSSRTGRFQIYSKDISVDDRAAIESQVTSGAHDYARPRRSPDGKRVAYDAIGESWSLEVLSIEDGAVVGRHADHFGLTDWLHAGDALIHRGLSVVNDEGRVKKTAQWFRHELVSRGCVPIVSHEMLVVSHEGGWIGGSSVSADGDWFAFNRHDATTSWVFVARLRPGEAVAAEDHILVGEGPWLDYPRWSPDGNLLYFLARDDDGGFTCIYAQRLDPRTKEPRGDRFAVAHFHSRTRSIREGHDRYWLDLSVVPGRLVFNLLESTGNLSVARLEVH